MRSPTDTEWDASQRRVIGAPARERLLVDAGPGTGKTAVACARVADLVNSGKAEAGRIWLISFTRTAVKEIRDRIALYLSNKDALWSVKIATVDSHAWSLHLGFSDGAEINGSYDDSIDRFLTMLDSDEEVRTYIAQTDHLIVDEAQDLVGIRADLVVALVSAMRDDAGVTVFSDEAQAIYGFTSDGEDDDEKERGEALTLRLEARGGFTRVALEQVHRTSSPNLKHIFTAVRDAVMNPGADLKAHMEGVRSAIQQSADQFTDKVFDPDESPPADGFMLFRRRIEALTASNKWCERQVQHRLRMSGFPSVIPPWIGALFGETDARYLSGEQFSQLYASRTLPHNAPRAGEAWDLLAAIAPGPRGSLSLETLRFQLARPQPPPSLMSPDYGSGGPVIATIHAAKGREADDVLMLMPQADMGRGDLSEETRIVFVGATRARNTLRVGKGSKNARGKNLESGRVYRCSWKDKQAAVEIGRAGDLEAPGVASTALFSSAEAVRVLQSRLVAMPPGAIDVRADAGPAPDYIYRIAETKGGETWGHFSGAVNGDLWKIAPAVREWFKCGSELKPPHYLQHLWLTGARTVALRHDDPRVDLLHEPWRSSGFVLVPMVHALCYTLFLPKFDGRRDN